MSQFIPSDPDINSASHFRFSVRESDEDDDDDLPLGVRLQQNNRSVNHYYPHLHYHNHRPPSSAASSFQDSKYVTEEVPKPKIINKRHSGMFYQ